MSLDDQLVAMSETQPWKFFALQGLNFQFLELNFQFLEGNFKMSEPCAQAAPTSGWPQQSETPGVPACAGGGSWRSPPGCSCWYAHWHSVPRRDVAPLGYRAASAQ